MDSFCESPRAFASKPASRRYYLNVDRLSKRVILPYDRETRTDRPVSTNIFHFQRTGREVSQSGGIRRRLIDPQRHITCSLYNGELIQSHLLSFPKRYLHSSYNVVRLGRSYCAVFSDRGLRSHSVTRGVKTIKHLLRGLWNSRGYVIKKGKKNRLKHYYCYYYRIFKYTRVCLFE